MQKQCYANFFGQFFVMLKFLNKHVIIEYTCHQTIETEVQ